MTLLDHRSPRTTSSAASSTPASPSPFGGTYVTASATSPLRARTEGTYVTTANRAPATRGTYVTTASTVRPSGGFYTYSH